MDMQPTPAAQGSPPMQSSGEESSPQSGYEICIKVMGDGTYQVSKEPLSAEEGETGEAAGAPGEGDMAGEGAEQSQRIDTFEGALKAAYGIYQENPEGADSESQMTDEFNGNGGQ